MSPRAYLVWEASPQLVVKEGGYGHAFKAPTLKQISPNYVGAEGPHTFMGSSIKPETSNAFEIGADWQALPGPGTAPRSSTPTSSSSSPTASTSRKARAAPTCTTTSTPRASRAWRVRRDLGRNARAAVEHRRHAAAHARQDHGRGTIRPPPHQRLLAPGVARGQLAGTTGPGLHRQPDQQWRTPGKLTHCGTPAWSAPWSVGDGRTLHLRTGLQNIGNLRLADKSPSFGYAEQGRRLFVNARLDF